MGLLKLLRRLLFGAPPSPDIDGELPAGETRHSSPAAAAPTTGRRKYPLPELRYDGGIARTPSSREETDKLPYQFATPSVSGRFLDLSTDSNAALLHSRGLPVLVTPADLAVWLDVPLPKLAWLAGRFYENHRPATVQDAHYHFRWLAKRSGGHRLIEAPKPLLKAVQQRILRDILDRVPAHSRAFGFVAGRSAISNAAEHVGGYVLLKLDLENFYASVRYSRVVAIFRTLGYSRAAALWLARLTTSAAPSSLDFPSRNPHAIVPYLPRHLPQGACTSPALANLSAFSLDVRLEGLARAYHATYTRYADDLTFSGSHRFAGALRDFIPLSERIVRQERFGLNKAKRRIIRRSGRQVVTGVVVNERLNVARHEYDRVKAILYNCSKTGPRAQNRENHPHFEAHLLGRIAYIESLNPARGQRLRQMLSQIDWSR